MYNIYIYYILFIYYEPSKVGDKTLTNSDGVLTEPPR